jgi:hypothetical protein
VILQQRDGCLARRCVAGAAQKMLAGQTIYPARHRGEVVWVGIDILRRAGLKRAPINAAIGLGWTVGTIAPGGKTAAFADASPRKGRM